MKTPQSTPTFLEALEFAAYRHRFDKTKNEEPYINHIINVCELLSVIGEVNDSEVLIAAALHDILEKTNTKPTEINFYFGEDVLHLVMEVTEHQYTVNETEKFQHQLNRVDSLSKKACLIKLADKIANVKSLLSYTPEGWDIQKRSLYINWAERIINALHGTNEKLEAYFDRLISQSIKNNLYISDPMYAG